MLLSTLLSLTIVASVATHRITIFRQTSKFCVDNIGHTYPVGFIKIFHCGYGFLLIGNKQIQCTRNGQWSDSFPQCGRVNIPTQLSRSCPDPLGRHTQYGIGYKFQFGNCDGGSRLVGDSILTCGTNGQWIGQIPICIPGPSSCTDPGIPVAGKRISHFNNHKLEIGTVMEFSCANGFIIAGYKEITCRQSGQWSALAPKCLPANDKS